MHSIVRYVAFMGDLQAIAELIPSVSGEGISTPGWRLWLDRDSAWTNDSVYLPNEVNSASLPVNAGLLRAEEPGVRN
jgi:hypothetical protein